MSSRLRRLVATVTASGAAALAAAALLVDQRPAWWRIAVVLALFFVGETAMFHIRLGHDHRTFTWAESACVIALAAAPGGWVVLLGTAGAATAHLLRRRPLVKVAFNASSVAIGLLTAWFVRREFVGTFEEANLSRPAAWLGLAAAAGAYFLVTTALVSGAVAWSQNGSFWSVHRKDLPLNALVAVGNIGMGVLVVSEAALEPALLLPLPLLIAALVYFYKTSLRAAQERDTWESLQSASGALLQLKGDPLHAALLDWSARLFKAEGVDLLLVQAGRSQLHSWRQEGGVVAPRAGDPFALAGTFWGRALSDREPFEIHITTAPAAQRDELVASGLESCMVAPLLVQNECIGTLRLGFRGRISLGRRERQVFATFANHVSSALHNDRLFSEVRTMALHDPLTGLPNRTLLIDQLEAALERAKRTKRDLAVLFLDLDQFKVVNDSLGHDVGDRLLVEISQRLTAALRPGDLATRFGGDEFVVICEGVANEREAVHIAERIADVLTGPLSLAGSDVYVTASIGVAVAAATNNCDAIGLIRDADAAMYKAKADGRARTHVFDSDTRARAVARLEIESQLRHAVERGELRLVYQPTLDASSQRVVGAEALVRWAHPSRGMVSPLDFIPVAEETGIISAIGAWVLDEACRQVAVWRNRTGFLDDDFRMAINLSPHQINDATLVEQVLASLARHRVPVDAICLEITESALLMDTDVVARNIRRLHEAGIELALDDFGTGYSSVSYLHRLPVKVLKIDRSFIARVGAGAREDAIVTGLVDLAHTLGMTVVAEGVETASQLAVVQDIGCDRVQGFYFAKPSSALQFEELVSTVAAF